MNEDVWRFNQLLGAGVRMSSGSLAQPYLQYERDYIADSLQIAIAQASEQLGFPPAPMWIENEYVALDPDYHWQATGFFTRFGRVLDFGQRAVSLIQAGATVSFSDSDGDQVDDRATVTVTTSIDPSEVCVFFRVTDGAHTGGSEAWEIDGLTRTSGAGTVTLTGHRALFTHPQAVWGLDYNSDNWNVKHTGDTGDSGAFVYAVDVYRVYCDPTNAAQLISHAGLTSAPIVDATPTLLDADYGLFSLYTSSTQTLPNAPPLALRVSYRAGLPLQNGRIEPRLETALIRYANTVQAQQPALGDRTQAMWIEDRAISELLSRADASAAQPFGISNAGHHLWQVTRSMSMTLKARM
jgi:hypothetical protein